MITQQLPSQNINFLAAQNLCVKLNYLTQSVWSEVDKPNITILKA